jgi:hypothetical protein
MAESNDIGIAAVNSNNPQEPEYGKGYKKWLHAGCCGSCGETNCQGSPDPSPTAVIRQRKTRADF